MPDFMAKDWNHFTSDLIRLYGVEPLKGQYIIYNENHFH